MSRHVNADARRRLTKKELEEANRPHAPAEREAEYHDFKAAWEGMLARKMIEKGVDE